MATIRVRPGTLADEAFSLHAVASIDGRRGELVAGLPIDRSRAARAIYRDLVAGTRGSVLVLKSMARSQA
jgi:hypothetical protein